MYSLIACRVINLLIAIVFNVIFLMIWVEVIVFAKGDIWSELLFRFFEEQVRGVVLLVLKVYTLS